VVCVAEEMSSFPQSLLLVGEIMDGWDVRGHPIRRYEQAPSVAREKRREESSMGYLIYPSDLDVVPRSTT
jgi:hypothetical protein